MIFELCILSNDIYTNQTHIIIITEKSPNLTFGDFQ